MHLDYSDITSKIEMTPLWYFNQAVAVPRYLPFHPELCGIYDDTVALVVIRCQSCHQKFFVSVGYDQMDRYKRDETGKFKYKNIVLPTIENPGWFDVWGDPPRHGRQGPEGCAAGDTMTSELVRIAEFWVREREINWPEWKRKPEYEFDYRDLLEDGI
jgi:hypothetical protein